MAWIFGIACAALCFMLWAVNRACDKAEKDRDEAERGCGALSTLLGNREADLLLSREQTRAAEESRDRAKAEVGKGLRAYDRELEGRLAAENALEQAQASGRELLASIASESKELTDLKEAFATVDGQLRECEAARARAITELGHATWCCRELRAGLDAAKTECLDLRRNAAALKASASWQVSVSLPEKKPAEKPKAKPKSKPKPKAKKRGAA